MRSTCAPSWKRGARGDRLLGEVCVEPAPLGHHDQRLGARAPEAAAVVQPKLEGVDDALDDGRDVARHLPQRATGDAAAARLVARKPRPIGEEDARTARGRGGSRSPIPPARRRRRGRRRGARRHGRTRVGFRAATDDRRRGGTREGIGAGDPDQDRRGVVRVAKLANAPLGVGAVDEDVEARAEPRDVDVLPVEEARVAIRVADRRSLVDAPGVRLAEQRSRRRTSAGPERSRGAGSHAPSDRGGRSRSCRSRRMTVVVGDASAARRPRTARDASGSAADATRRRGARLGDDADRAVSPVDELVCPHRPPTAEARAADVDRTVSDVVDRRGEPEPGPPCRTASRGCRSAPAGRGRAGASRGIGADRLVDEAPVGRVVARSRIAPVAAGGSRRRASARSAASRRDCSRRRSGGRRATRRGGRRTPARSSTARVASRRARRPTRPRCRPSSRCRRPLVPTGSRPAPASGRRPRRSESARRRPPRPTTAGSGRLDSRRTRSTLRPATRPARRRSRRPRRRGACGCRLPSSRRGRASPSSRSTRRSAVRRETTPARHRRLPDWRSGRAQCPLRVSTT